MRPVVPSGTSVLVVDDEPALNDVVGMALEARGYRVTVCTTGVAALRAAGHEPPDIVLLDLGLPDLDGVEVCRSLREWFENPIVVLSADGAEERKIDALDAGADDYVTKPFSMPELLARLRVATRHRVRLGAPARPERVEVGALVVDTVAHTATVAGAPMTLTRKEFALLAALARNADGIVRHEQILSEAWAPDGGTPESVRVHVTHLRQKLGTGPGRPEIRNEPRVGYRLVLDDS